MLRTSNKKRALSLLMTLALVVSLLAGLGATASAAPIEVYSGQAGPGIYSISNSTQLALLATKVTAGNNYYGSFFHQTQNISITSSWNGIGTPSITTNPNTSSPLAGGNGFAGTYNGFDHTLTVARSASTSGVGGVFNYVMRDGVIMNLTVEGTLTVTGSVDAIGGVVGYNSGTINNVKNKVDVTASNAFNVGGITGFLNGQYLHVADYKTSPPLGVVVNSINEGDVVGRQKVGGITGQNSGAIAFCANLGDITATDASRTGAGGIAGRNGNNNTPAEMGYIDDCYNMGDIELSNGRWGGGITGFNNALSRVKNCYNTGAVLHGYANWNAIIGSNENFGVQAGFANFCETSFSSAGSAIETGSVPSVNMQSDAFRELLEDDASEDDQWAWDGVENDGYPYFLRTADAAISHGRVTPNSYPYVYLSNTGSDLAAGDIAARAVKTLGRALTIASLSDDPNVYIKVINTNVISNNQNAFGSDIPVVWEPETGATSPMFQINNGGSLVVGGVDIDGNGVSVAIQVNGYGSFTIRNNASIVDCTTAITVANNGNLTVNRSTIGGTTSISLANATSSCTLFAGPGQTINITGTISLGGTGSATTHARLKIGSAITGTLKISATPASAGRIIAQVDGAYAAFTTADRDMFTYVGGGHGFVLAANNTQINLT